MVEEAIPIVDIVRYCIIVEPQREVDVFSGQPPSSIYVDVKESNDPDEIVRRFGGKYSGYIRVFGEGFLKQGWEEEIKSFKQFGILDRASTVDRLRAVAVKDIKHVAVAPIMSYPLTSNQKDVLYSWNRQKRASIQFLEDEKLELRNEFGTPFVKQFFDKVYESDADTYTVINSDIIVDSGFIAAGDDVVLASWTGVMKPRFIGIGRRYNVDWDIYRRNISSIQDFLEQVPNQRYTHLGMDYFITSRNAARFGENNSKLIPPDIVIGRPAWDNIVTLHGIYNEDVITAIDMTITAPVVHQNNSTKKGRKQFMVSFKKADSDHNSIIARKMALKFSLSSTKLVLAFTNHSHTIQYRHMRGRVASAHQIPEDISSSAWFSRGSNGSFYLIGGRSEYWRSEHLRRFHGQQGFSKLSSEHPIYLQYLASVN